MGRYPYYPHCHVRNYTNEFTCYNPAEHDKTSNTFVTGMWDGTDFLFQTWRIGADDIQPYKCCKTPANYYLDYLSCYYVPTHDMFFEYYDSPTFLATFCMTGYVVAGISKKINPNTKLYALDYLQCCRVGFGPPEGHEPPITGYGKDQTPVYSSSREAISRIEVSDPYRSQYQRMPESRDLSLNITIPTSDGGIHIWSSRYSPAKPQNDIRDHEETVVPVKAWPTDTVI